MRILSAVWLVVFFFYMPAFSQPVLDAAGKGDLEKVKQLLEKNPELMSVSDDEESTFLHYAAFGGDIRIIELAFQSDPDINHVNISGESPLHYAAYAGQTDAIRLLLKKGADVNCENIENYSPLHYACMTGKTETVRFLLGNGAELNKENFYNQTPLELAMDSNHKETADFLESIGGKLTAVREADLKSMSLRVTRILFPFGRVSSIALFSGKEGNLLIDSGFTPRTIDKLNDILAQTENPELKYLINTHLHPDHVAGNAIAGKNTVVINFNNLDKMVSDGILTVGEEKLSGKTGPGFEHYYVLHFNNEEIRLIPWPGIHTDADILIHFPKEGIVHAGDLLIPRSFPSVRLRVDDYLQFLQKLIDVFPSDTRFICGHGPECSMDEISSYLTMLTDATAIIRSYIKAGKGKKDIREEGALSVYDAWGEFIPQLNYNYWVDAVFRKEAEQK